MTEHILSMIGLAKKAGQVAIGEEPVGAAARAKDARVILVAQDAAPGSVRRAMSFGQAGACLCLTVPFDKDRLGRALGRTSCAMAAVTDHRLCRGHRQKSWRPWTRSATPLRRSGWRSRPAGPPSAGRSRPSMKRICAGARRKSTRSRRLPRQRFRRSRKSPPAVPGGPGRVPRGTGPALRLPPGPQGQGLPENQ